jgi:hypothetical protein
MTLAEGFGAATPVRGSTPATNYADDLTNVVDLFTRSGYIPETSASYARNIDYRDPNTSEAVKVSSAKRPKMVQVDIVVRGASKIVAVLCVASLLLSFISKFDMFNPLIALLMLIGAVSFYGMTLVKPGTELQNNRQS